MSRPSDWSPLGMDSDPTPGDPNGVRDLADELQAFADDVGEALGKIRGMAGDRAVQEWAGLSAETFRAEFDGVPENLTKLQTSYDLCARALQGYWPKLETAQGQADRALERAIAAQADLTSARGELGSAEDWVARAGAEADRLRAGGGREDALAPDEDAVRAAVRDGQAAEEARGAAQSRVDDAESRLSAARALAEQAREMRDEAARTAARDIDEASDAGIRNRSWWEKLIHWFTEAWDTIVAVCKVIVAVLGVVALIIGGPIAWVVLGAALVVLADSLIKFSQGRGSLLDVAFAALDCIPGMRGLTTLGGLARGIKGGLGAARTGLRGITAGARGAGRRVRGLGRPVRELPCRGDPVDMASGAVVMSATDVDLPGVLPLVIERHHRSTVRTGRCFGPSWASTLDQRLVLDDEGVRLCADDGMVLYYPRPLPDAPVLPVEGPRWALSWDGTPGTGLRVTRPDTGRTLHFAHVPGRRGGELPVTALTDRNDNAIRFLYDAAGSPSRVVHDGGYEIGVTTAGGRVTELRLLSDPRQPVLLSYGYDARGDLTEIRNSSGLPLRLDYDGGHRITGWEDRRGTRYRYTYDDRGRCVATEGAGGVLSSTIAYEDRARRTRFTDSLGHTTVLTFNDCFQPVEETDPLGNRTLRSWDRHDNLLSLTDPLGRTTVHRYDEAGNRTAEERPDGTRLLAAHDARGLLTSFTAADGARWLHTYDDAGNLTSTTDPMGGVSRFAYDARGAMTAATDALGHTREFEPDARGLPTAVRELGGGVTRYAHTPTGRVASITEPGGATTLIEWDLEGHPLRRVHPDGAEERWEWDAEGTPVRHTDPAGGETRVEVGPFDVPVALTDPSGERTTYTFDTELRLTAVRNGRGLTWEYVHDPLGRTLRETDFTGRTTEFAYDPAGRLAARRNGAGQEVVYAYDLLGHLVRQTADDGEVTSYTYDAAERMTEASNRHARLTLAHDALGRITAESVNGRTMRYWYDALGRRVSRGTPGGVGSVLRYDGAGRPVAVTVGGHALRVEHDTAGRETALTLGAARLRQEWDARHRLVAQDVLAPAGTVQRRTFSYRPDGHIGTVDDLLAGGASRYTLDGTGRPTRVRTPRGDEAYAYDGGGDLLHGSWPAAAGGGDGRGRRAYGGGLLRRAGTLRFEYDGQGRVVRRLRKLLSGGTREWRFTWDADDRMTGAVTPDGHHWTYHYDPLGRRIAKQRVAPDGTPDPSGRTEFAWDGTHLAEQTTYGGGGRRTLTWDWDVATRRPYCQHERWVPDGEGDDRATVDERFFAIVLGPSMAPAELVDAEGRVAWRAEHSVWGVPTAVHDDAGTDCPLRFPGQYFDAETSLHYNVLRYYDPEAARYQSPDPLGLVTPNHYAYVRNPLTWSDPLGLTPCTHYASVRIHGPDGRVRVAFSVRSGDQTPEELALGFPNGSLASHTENRVARMIGGSPTVPIVNDSYANLIPAGPGDTVIIVGTRQPCPQCRGAMNRATRETGALFGYIWGHGPNNYHWWQTQA